MDLVAHIAAKIRDLRVNYNNGEGLSQQILGEHLNVAANTISRWETGTYCPSMVDTERIARFFGVPMMDFIPHDLIDEEGDEKLKALLRTARQLHPADVEELQKYAEFRRARGIRQGKTRPKPGRKGGKNK